jgi:hypothetical protein
MAEVIKITYQLRRGTSAVWNNNNPLLAAGEPGYELDTHKVKIGDGTSYWKDLPYIGEHNIVVYASRNEFPSVGNVNYIYKATDEAMLYFWDSLKKEYVAIGPAESGDIGAIDYIDGGNAFGPY